MSSPDPLAALTQQPRVSPDEATRAKAFARPERTLDADAGNRARHHSDERLGACWTVAERARRDAQKADDAARVEYWEIFLRALAVEAARRRVPDRGGEWGEKLLAARDAVRDGRDPLEGG